MTLISPGGMLHFVLMSKCWHRNARKTVHMINIKPAKCLAFKPKHICALHTAQL